MGSRGKKTFPGRSRNGKEVARLEIVKRMLVLRNASGMTPVTLLSGKS